MDWHDEAQLYSSVCWLFLESFEVSGKQCPTAAEISKEGAIGNWPGYGRVQRCDSGQEHAGTNKFLMWLSFLFNLIYIQGNYQYLYMGSKFAIILLM